MSSAFLKQWLANSKFDFWSAKSATRSHREELSANFDAVSTSSSCIASSNRCSGSVETANACCLKPFKIQLCYNPLYILTKYNWNVNWKHTCFSRKWATRIRCSFGTVGKTLSAVSKSLLITAVWYSNTDNSKEYDTTFNSLSPTYNLRIKKHINIQIQKSK